VTVISIVFDSPTSTFPQKDAARIQIELWRLCARAGQGGHERRQSNIGIRMGFRVVGGAHQIGTVA